MRALEEYIFDMETWTTGDASGSGLAVLALTAAGTGTGGVTTPQAGLPLPVPTVAGEGSWRPLGVCPLPSMAVSANRDGWRPGRGTLSLPRLELSGQASLPLIVDLVLPPLFYTATAGGCGANRLPAIMTTVLPGALAALALQIPSPYGLSGCNRQSAAACLLPDVSATAWSCGLDDPVRNGTAADDVVALLCQGNAALTKAALALADGATLASVGADVLAGRLLAAVATNLTYADDTDGDVWTCALGTYSRGVGDCEDGAILLHGLLLAAGLPADRLVTTFGRVGTDRQGHAWLTYRRASDGNWVVLDWTTGAGASVAALSPISDVPSYAAVDYALTSQSFFAVRQSPARFFSSIAAVDLALPLPDSAAAASLGTAGVCPLAAGWLRPSGRTGCRGQGKLSCLAVTATIKSTRLTVPLASLSAQALTGLSAAADLPEPSVCGRTLGGWGKGCLAPARPAVAGRAVQVGRNAGPIALGRLRLLGEATAGLGGDGLVGWSRCNLDGRAWPGALAQERMRLPLPLATAIGGPTGPGSGLETLPPWLAQGTGMPADARLADYRWETATLEAW